MEVKVSGASDDLIEIDGGIYEEFYAYGDEENNYLAFSDGTLLSVVYDVNGFWRISALFTGTSTTLEKHEASDEDSDYSDIVTLQNAADFLWVVHGKSYAKKTQPKS